MDRRTGRDKWIEENGDKRYITNSNGKEFTFNEYIDFLFDEENIGECDICPEYRADDGWCGNHPCGQQHCVVRIHCEHAQRGY